MDEASAPDAPLLSLRGLEKSFPGVRALRAVDFEVRAGEIMALVGENGAGKSTLMKILNGVDRPDAGSLRWRGQEGFPASPAEAQAAGISMIHQELALVPDLDVGRNLFLGREPRWGPGLVDRRRLYREAQEELDQLGLAVDARATVRDYPLAQQQMIEVAKALSLRARLLVMDEPTSSLTGREVEVLFERMRSLRSRGIALVFISHRMEEIFAIADRITIMRDGAVVSVDPAANLDADEVIRRMVGREVGDPGEGGGWPAVAADAEPLLEVEGLGRGRAFRDISFRLQPGEILGVSGLVGAGRTELAEALFGVRPAEVGRLRVQGREQRIRHPGDALRAGIALVPEDRKGQGLFLGMSVGANTVMAVLSRFLAAGLFLRHGRLRRVAEQFVERLRVRTPSVRQEVRNLSGGNQQKVVIAKWLALEPKVLILDEPTRGIDVGAKAEIYRLMRSLAAEGMGILMISSELPEILGVSTRILVLHEGRLAGSFLPAETDSDELMRAATGTRAVAAGEGAAG